MNNARTKLKKGLSLLLVITMVATMMPIVSAMAAPIADTRVTDPSTLDGWVSVFGDPTSSVISTENAGSVWTDKTVLKDAQAFAGINGITLDGADNRSMLVALSAMGSNLSVTGKTSAPLDTILVLDVSGSMNNNNGNNDAAEDLVDAANASIAKLFEAGDKNRVGVVLYSSEASVILPLGSYTTANDKKYLTYSTSGGNEYISLDTDVRIAGTLSSPSSTTKEVAGATYIQDGIYAAMEQFTAINNETTVDGVKRLPVMILMSDGSPTYSSTSFMNPGNHDLGDGQASSTSAAQGFVTQLTAAYAKAQVEQKYGQDMLFYTLGFKVDTESVAEYVLDPAAAQTDTNTTATAINDFWTSYANAAVGGTVKVQSTGRWEWQDWNWVWVETRVWNVTKLQTPLEQAYVTQYFSASNNLTSVFDTIIGETLLKAQYYPTLIRQSDDLSGYVSFVDQIGHHMSVTDIKGVLVGDTLYSGADLASNFADGANGGLLGSSSNPTATGAEMVHSVQQRLGIENIDTARTLIERAYQSGQLSYTDASNFSNYIGWYANKAGKYLGHWHEGSTTIPPATGNEDTDPYYLIKSYGYLGKAHSSDMMYATVQIRKEIATGDETVAFAIPAALLPIMNYQVSLNTQGQVDSVTIGGATAPMRLVYEVGLDPHINELTVHDPAIVGAAYVAENRNADGSVNFYTNQWDADHNIGYGTQNAYSYFNPAKENDRYYYTDHSLIYTDANGTKYNGGANAKPATDGTFYRAFTVYTKNGASVNSHTAYERISAASLSKAVYDATEGWYIPEKTVHTYLDGFEVYKTANATGTLTETFGTADTADDKGIVSMPYVDTHNHEVDDSGYYFYVGSTLGNNGLLTVTPATGIKLSKSVADSTDTTDTFTFTVVGSAADANQTYPVTKIAADGSATESTLDFDAVGIAAITLHNGETAYITGMTNGRTYTITENETAKYRLQSVNGSETTTQAVVTVVDHQLGEAAFVNELRGTGNLTVSKIVEHELGADYQMPNKRYAMTVTLAGIGTANTTFAATHTGIAGITAVSTNSSGVFTVELAHDERIEISGLPAGTVATVTEAAYAGFTPTYYNNGVASTDPYGSVAVTKNGVSSVIVINEYQPASVYPVNVNLSGQKTYEYNGAWNDTFEFVLRRWNEAQSRWDTVATKTADSAANSTFNFNTELAAEPYTKPGRYTYQVIETNGGTTVNGITYDPTVHSFGVDVTDATMDGRLEIARVVSYHTGQNFAFTNNTWVNDHVNFVNTYHASGSSVSIDIQKRLVNPSNSPLVSAAGFSFGLYAKDPVTGEATGAALATSSLTDAAGSARVTLTYALADAGDHEYILKEIVPATVNPRMTYAPEAYTVKTRVSDNGDGTTSAVVVSITDQSNTPITGHPQFTNTYVPTSTTLDLGAKKILRGRDMQADEFTFALYPRGSSQAIATGTNAAAQDGAAAAITFAPAVTYTQVGVYYYDVKETSVSEDGVTVDSVVRRVEVVVVDDNGQLKATHRVLNLATDDIVFENAYAPKEVSYAISGEKVLVGRELINDEFTFVLKDTATQQTYYAQNFVDGHFTFEELTYTAVGTYTYTVSEQQSGNAYGVQYDTTEYTVTVTVEDDQTKGELYIASVKVDGDPNKVLSFTNRYVPAAVGQAVLGDKILTGKVLEADQFEFELYEADDQWNFDEADPLETVRNDATGKFTFTKLGEYDANANAYLFNKAGSYYYVVKEKNGGSDIDGVLYDAAFYRVRIDITDDLLGQLHAQVHVFDAQDIPQIGIVFTNEYRVTTPAAVAVNGNKTLTGKALEADEFTFLLYAADGAYTVAENAVPVEAKNKADGTFAFDEIEIPAAGTYYYVVKEKVDSAKTEITYDETEYRIAITVEDNGDGRLVETNRVILKKDATESVEAIAFHNVYTAPPADPPANPPVNPPAEEPPVVTPPAEDPPAAPPAAPPVEEPPAEEPPAEEPPAEEPPAEEPPVVTPPTEEPPVELPETGELSSTLLLAMLLICGSVAVLFLLRKKEGEPEI